MSYSSYHHKKNKNLLHARPSSRITLTYKRLMVITVETKLKMSWRVVPDTDYKQVVVWYGGLKAGNDVNGLTSLCKPLATCCRALILGNTCSMCRNLPWSLAAETTHVKLNLSMHLLTLCDWDDSFNMFQHVSNSSWKQGYLGQGNFDLFCL